MGSEALNRMSEKARKARKPWSYFSIDRIWLISWVKSREAFMDLLSTSHRLLRSIQPYSDSLILVKRTAACEYIWVLRWNQRSCGSLTERGKLQLQDLTWLLLPRYLSWFSSYLLMRMCVYVCLYMWGLNNVFRRFNVYDGTVMLIYICISIEV